jgi:hypothetical protein
LLFGKEYEILAPKPSDKSPIATSYWSGKNFSLVLHYWYTGLWGEDWCTILISDNQFKNQSINSGF